MNVVNLQLIDYNTIIIWSKVYHQVRHTLWCRAKFIYLIIACLFAFTCKILHYSVIKGNCVSISSQHTTNLWWSNCKWSNWITIFSQYTTNISGVTVDGSNCILIFWSHTTTWVSGHGVSTLTPRCPPLYLMLTYNNQLNKQRNDRILPWVND